MKVILDCWRANFAMLGAGLTKPPQFATSSHSTRVQEKKNTMQNQNELLVIELVIF
jgi:hypothetical protein